VTQRLFWVISAWIVPHDFRFHFRDALIDLGISRVFNICDVEETRVPIKYLIAIKLLDRPCRSS
jgi:hypothetical protein